MGTPENMHDERAEYAQHDHVRKQEQEVHRGCQPVLSSHRRRRKQCDDNQDAQHDGERIPCDAPRIPRFLSAERNTRRFTRSKCAETEDDGKVVNAGSDDDANANVGVTTNDRHERSRVIGDIGPDCAEQTQHADREAKHFAKRFKPARKPYSSHHHHQQRDEKEAKCNRKQGEGIEKRLASFPILTLVLSIGPINALSGNHQRNKTFTRFSHHVVLHAQAMGYVVYPYMALFGQEEEPDRTK